MPRDMVRLQLSQRRTIFGDQRKTGNKLNDCLDRRLVVLSAILLFFAGLLEREIFVVLGLLLLKRLRVGIL